MKEKTKKKDSEKTRYWIEVLVILVILGGIFVNSMNPPGYVRSELTHESGELVAYTEGYSVENNHYDYTGDENSYVQISTVAEGADQLMLIFDAPSKKGADVILNYVDYDGNLMEEITEAYWEKGQYTVTIDTVYSDCNSYLIHIPADFILSKVYYARHEVVSPGRRTAWLVLMLVVVVILTAVIVAFQGTRKYVVAAEEKVIDGYLYMKYHWQEVGKIAGKFIGIVAATVIVAYLLAQAGLFVYSNKVSVMAICLGSIFAIFILFYKKLTTHLEVIGFFVILLMGSMFAFTEPSSVGVSWDDEVHFRNAVQLSHIFDERMSLSDEIIIGDYTYVALEKKNYPRSQQVAYNQILNEIADAHYYADKGGYSAKNTLFAYIPSAIGLILARGLGMSYCMTLAVGRWMNTLVLAILSYFAMKRLKTGKIVVLLIALIPTNIFMAGNYNYDTWLTGWSMLGLAAFFGEWQQPEKKMDRTTPWVIGISMLLAVLPKQVYFPLTFIALFLPQSKFNNKKECWIYRMIVLAAALLPFVAVYVGNIMMGIGMGDPRAGAAVDATSQMDFVKSSPGEAVMIILNFLKSYLNPLSQGTEYITKMAYFGYTPMNMKFLLGVMIVGACVSREEGETKFPWWTKLGCIVVYAGIGAIAAVSMYIAFTGVGAESVAGCQGRYLIPALFPVLYVCSRFSFKTRIKDLLKENNINLILMLIMMTASVWGLWTGCIAWY